MFPARQSHEIKSDREVNMNYKSWSSIGLRLSVCLLLLLIQQPIRVGAGEGKDHASEPAPTVASPSALDFTAIEAGGGFTCSLTVSGAVKCWGANRSGQLGDGSEQERSSPGEVFGLSSGATAIAVGYAHACAVVAGGGVKCWGQGAYGRLGNGTGYDHSTPVNVVGLSSGVTAITAGILHTCAIVAGGGVKCWGSNWYGEVGDGTGTVRFTPVDVFGLSQGVIAITAGGYHSCALLQTGGVKCWGYNENGQLGDGTISYLRSTPVDVVGLDSGAAAVAAGVNHSCALTDQGGVKCWGYNGVGELGDGTTESHTTPVDVVGLGSDVMAIAADFEHSCVLASNGGVKCWGYNLHGQLGDGTLDNRLMPVDVIGLVSGGAGITAGIYHTCALISGGGAKCWGENGTGQLGDGVQYQRSMPVDVVGLAGNTAGISAGGSHTCALTASGGVKCWGDNEFGKLGDFSENDRSTPVDVYGLTSGASSVVASTVHTCALTVGGGARCWGNNAYGQLGDGTYRGHPNPVNVIGLASGVTDIALGRYHTCAVISGEARCWGYNYNGQLGDGTNNDSTTPVGVAGLDSYVTAIAAGYRHTCAIVSGGVKCWGSNVWGQLGDGTADDSNIPVDVTGLDSGVSAIAAGTDFTCTLVSGGVKCWGNNTKGQLGDGTTENRSTPVNVVGLTSRVTAISTGDSHTCALISDAGAWCWGNDQAGQLGDGATDQQVTPVAVIGLADHVMAISAGGDHTCALAGAGRAKCWGGDRYGQLGIGTLSQHRTPVDVLEFPPLRLTAGYTYGQPGSYFTLSGWNFPPGGQTTLVINGETITTTISVNPTGSFILFLDTSLAEPGGYAVTVSVLPGSNSLLGEPLSEQGDISATTGFFLWAEAPLRPHEGGGQTFLVPAGIAHTVYFTNLPLVGR
jgi:alpha-tubulin suppressor-like RCC1 family protein